MMQGREDLGIPQDWAIVESWINRENILVYPGPEKEPVYERKNKEIPILENYRKCPEQVFWEAFPKSDLPLECSTKVNIPVLEELVKKHKNKLTNSELRRAKRVILDLKTGADSCQKGKLPALSSVNSESAFENGVLLTDKIVTWIREGYVAGPFESAPMPGFRANPLIAVARNNKVRPVINMSGPKGRSFNDNLDKSKIEKVNMTTARQFSYTLKEAGKGAKFSKFDIVDAYKLIPAKPSDYKLQGFTWLGKHFCETQQTFGAVPSVCNFDRLGNTVLSLVACSADIPKRNVSRTLDDFQGVGCRKSDIAEKFTHTMKSVCESLNIPLAKPCEKREKAFELETEGVVLGTRFNSESMEWSISQEKAEKVTRRCLEACSRSHMSLHQTQELMGTINDLAQMNRFLKFFKSSGNVMLSKFRNDENILLMTPEETKMDWKVVGRAAKSSFEGLPIASRRSKPPLSALIFYTDAAGAKYFRSANTFHMMDEPERGVSCIGGDNIEDIWMWGKLSWSKCFLELKDGKGVEYGRKSTTLESFGLLIPLLAYPKEVAGRHLIFNIDNKAVH